MKNKHRFSFSVSHFIIPKRTIVRILILGFMVCLGLTNNENKAYAQSVCLPSPRLLTVFPMGTEAGKTVEVTVTGNFLDDIESLHFSNPAITAVQVVNKKGVTIEHKFNVTVPANCPAGVYEAWVMSRLGISTCRAFLVGKLPEVIQKKANTSLKTAKQIKVNTVCNAVMTKQAIDYYSFNAKKGQRIIVDCAAGGIDSKLQPVVIVGDSKGTDILVERRGGVIDFHAPESANFTIKVHDLTYKGGSPFFYRLSLLELGENDPIVRSPSIKNVNSFSWPPPGLVMNAAKLEAEPNNTLDKAQTITLPADISGRFYPAADVDLFHFNAKKGEVWWVEVGSERLGLKTNPAVLVQHIKNIDGKETITEVAELNDIASPIKVSSNAYSYDGPPYNAGSTDIIGKVEIKNDGLHRLQISDLFGGTQNKPENRYRLIIRKATPDFAVVGWALHMTLRNGDRNALSKPLSLRGGTTVAIEVSVVRRDGFKGEINLDMKDLPKGVTATGVKIASGKNRGILLVTANADSPRGVSNAKLFGTADINGKKVTRSCFLASMKWPVADAWGEIPNGRLFTAVPVSVCGSEQAPLTIKPTEEKVWEVRVGEKLTIPLTITSRCDHSGTEISLKTFSSNFGTVPAFKVPLKSGTSKVDLDLKALKTPPGEYQIAFYGKAVAKYRHDLKKVARVEKSLKELKKKAANLKIEADNLTQLAKTVTAKEKGRVEETAQKTVEKHKQALIKVTAEEKRLAAVKAIAQPKDIVDIIVSKPCTIRVPPKEKP